MDAGAAAGRASSSSTGPAEREAWRAYVAAAFARGPVDVDKAIEIESGDEGPGLPSDCDIEMGPEYEPMVAVKEESASNVQAQLASTSASEGASLQPSAALRAEFERRLVEAEAAIARKRPALPWETGFMKRVFGDKVKEKELLPLWLADPSEIEEEEAACPGEAGPGVPVGPLLARRAPTEVPLGWLQAKDKRREEEIGKWLGLLLASPQGSEVGRLLEQKRRNGMERPNLGRLLSGFFSSRDPLTLSRHRVAIEQFLAWREQGGAPKLLPNTLDDVRQYMEELWSKNAAGSRSIQFYKTCLFLGHVVGIAALRELDKDAVASGFATQARRRIRHRLKRRALTVAEVEKLESIVGDEEQDEQSRIVAGALLCGLLARARWHELGATMKAELSGEGLSSFVELEVASVKTAAQHLRGRAAFCMTACGHGVHPLISWAATWLALREKAGLRADTPGGVIESPVEGGQWSNAPMSVARARSWMAHLLGAKDDLLGTHSLKATLLTWANAAGLGDESRRAMGYHSSAAGRKSSMIELYGRDAQASAARITSQLVGAVRRGLLQPDQPRGQQYPKGYSVLAAALSMGRSGKAEQEEQSDRVSEGSGNDSSEEGSGGETDGECAVDTELFAHNRLGTIHRVTAEGLRHFRCGRFNTSDVYSPVGLHELQDAFCCKVCFR